MINKEFSPNQKTTLQKGLREYRTFMNNFTRLELDPDEDMAARTGMDFNKIKVVEIKGNLWQFDGKKDWVKAMEFLDQQGFKISTPQE